VQAKRTIVLFENFNKKKKKENQISQTEKKQKMNCC